MKNIKSRIISLQETRWHRLLSLLASVGLSVSRRDLVMLHRDSDGDWENRQRGVVLYSRRYSTVRYSEITQNVNDLFCYAAPITEGSIVIDVGAGVGDDVVVLSRLVGASGTVIAIEANPSTFRCLEKTIAANQLPNVIALHVAISDVEGETLIEDTADHLANRMSETSGTAVRSTTLEALFRDLNLADVAMVKINIEGAEAEALRGAKNIMRNVASWVISCHDFIAHRPGYEKSATYSEVTAALRNAGARVLPPRDDPRPWVPYYVYAIRDNKDIAAM